MKKILIFVLCTLILSSIAYAEIDLNSKVKEISSMDFSGKNLIEILNQVTYEGTLDESVPKRTLTTPEGNFMSVFTFNLGSEPESIMTELVNAFKSEDYKVIKEVTNGAELYNGETRIFLIRNNNILVEYKITETYKSAEINEKIKIDSKYVPYIIVGIVVLGLAGFVIYKKKKGEPIEFPLISHVKEKVGSLKKSSDYKEKISGFIGKAKEKANELKKRIPKRE